MTSYVNLQSFGIKKKDSDNMHEYKNQTNQIFTQICKSDNT
jgi:hypothetical protein